MNTATESVPLRGATCAPPWRRTVAALFWAFCLAWLAGCAQPLAPVAGKEDAWNGRIALQVEGKASQSFSALFELRGNEKKGGLALISPLGNRLAQVDWEDGHAQWTSPQETRSSESLDALLQDMTGAPIPVGALFSWLKGTQTTVPGWRVDLSALDQGRLVAHRDEPAPPATLRIALTR